MTVHEIVTNEALPIRLHHYQCPIAAWQDNFLQELDFLKEKNFIVPYFTMGGMFAVPKRTGDLHLVVDYRHLTVTVPDLYVMPLIEVRLEMMGKV